MPSSFNVPTDLDDLQPISRGTVKRRRCIRNLMVPLLALSSLASCSVFGVGQTYRLTGAFVATQGNAPQPAGACSASVEGQPRSAAPGGATWTWTSSFMGRSDLPALQILCSLGGGYDDGYLMITIPNLPPNARVAQRTFTFIQLDEGSWSEQSDPGVASIVGKLPPLTSGYLSSRSGQLTITRADSAIISGSFTLVARHEWSL